MDTLIPLLREKRTIRDEKHSTLEAQQNLEYSARRRELQEMKEQIQQSAGKIGRNLNIITGHRHAISKAVNESKQCNGLPISNKHHKQTLDFLTDAVTLLNNGNNLFAKSSSEEKIVDSCKLSADVQSCTQSSSDLFKAMQSSVVKAEMLVQNIPVIMDHFNDNEPDLETSVFD